MTELKPMPYVAYECECRPYVTVTMDGLNRIGCPAHGLLADVLAQRKHLTDAECAAEYWRARLKVCASGNRDIQDRGHLCAEWALNVNEAETLYRFATHPHAHEEQA